MARIGFYGGTFNPIHLGHVGVCRQAVKQLRLDCLHVIPAFIPPHKVSPDLAAGEDRLAMCRLALQGLPNILADDYELTRGGVSYRDHAAYAGMLLRGRFLPHHGYR